MTASNALKDRILSKRTKEQRAKRPKDQKTKRPKDQKPTKDFFWSLEDTVKSEAVAFTNMKSPHENHVHLTDLVIDYAREGLSSRADCSDSE
jgi:hypothetical protein